MSLAEAVRADLPATAQAPGLARREVRDALVKFGLERLEDDATLIVSEIVTNAFVHGGDPIRLRVYVDAGLLFVEVEDGGRELVPQMRHVGPDAVSGRGLYLVDEVAADWGVEQLVGGVRVWASLNAGAAPEAGPEPADAGRTCRYGEPAEVLEPAVAGR